MKIFFTILFACLFCLRAEACGTTGCKGCLRTNIDKSVVWSNFVDTVKAKTGAYPISCFRTYKCQAELAASCGRGRANRPGCSNHEGKGIALDYRTSNGDHKKAKRFYSIIKGPISETTHGGGGFHMGNGQLNECAKRASAPYQRKSKRVQSYKKAKKSQGWQFSL